MPDPIDVMSQPKATTLDGIAIETKARELLSDVILDSISRQLEVGGIIYRDNKTKKLASTGPFWGFSASGVDVGQNTPNCGCPEGATPVAIYHTHPMKERWFGSGEKRVRITFAWDKYIEGDKQISDDNNLIGYVGTFDMRMWRYDQTRGRMINGKWASEFGRGQYGPLNGLLMPKKQATSAKPAPKKH